MKIFFITGLPRSRTAWLANLFTYGSSFCYHDFLKCGKIPNFSDPASQQQRPTDCEYVGDCDSGLIHCAPSVRVLYPQARWLFVRRDKDQARESFEYYFQDCPYPGVPREVDLRNLFASCEANFYAARAAVPADFRAEVDFHSLDDPPVVRDIWEWLTPENPWNEARFKMLDQMRVNVIPEKLEVVKWP